jgi:hypothetical protein
MDGPVLLFAWLTLVISWVAFLSFRSFVTFTCLVFLLAIYPHHLIPFLDRRSTEWPSSTITDAVFYIDNAFTIVESHFRSCFTRQLKFNIYLFARQ